MASKTIYSCDHCGKHVSNGKELTKIHLIIGLETPPIERRPTFTREVCDWCLKEFGIVEDKSSMNYVSNYIKVGNRFFDMVNKFFKKS